jgi:enoyl-CoA hydratase / long-chain 3-hydroxyacyl-CoA dehydrogenase
MLPVVSAVAGSLKVGSRISFSIHFSAMAIGGMRAASTFTSWEKQGNVGILKLHDPDARMNTLNAGLVTEMEAAIKEFSKYDAVVIISEKKDNFIAGADIKMLAAAADEQSLVSLSKNGQVLLQKIEDSTVPVVAAINGACLGGGLEVALACQYRVASSASNTKLGLPEVKLGLLPGAGGTVRLTSLVGIQKALPMMLTGSMLNAERARKMGLVDLVADPSALKEFAIRAAQSLADGSLKKRKGPKLNLLGRALEETGPGRNLIFKKAREQVEKTAGKHYPAPFAILDVVQKRFEAGKTAGYEAEAAAFGKLGRTPVSKALVSIFFADTALKKNRFGQPAQKLDHILVQGAGLMGSGIATVSVKGKIPTYLHDVRIEALLNGHAEVYKSLSEAVKKRRTSPVDRDITFSRCKLLANEQELHKVSSSINLVIEAIPENLELKRKVLATLAGQMPSAIIATNTSALPLSAIASALPDPTKLVGMHYFSPVPKMPLLEVIVGDTTSNEAAAVAVDCGLRQGKTVIVVKDGPGFYTTRILAPMMVESAALLLEGVSIPDMEKSLRSFGFPVGPISLLDEVGIDIGLHIMPTLQSAFGARMGGGGESLMREMVNRGEVGRKSGKGFFLYAKDNNSKKKKGGKKEINPTALELIKEQVQPNSNQDLLSETAQVERLFLRMVNEAVFCLQDGILSSPVDGDIGAVFGLGFPPFLGGPFRWIDSVGADVVVQKMEYYEKSCGERFKPAPLLVEKAQKKELFHSE